MKNNSNGFGTAGLILSIFSLFIGWFPLIGYILIFLAYIFSIIGVFRRPRGAAIAGIAIATVAFLTAILAIVLATGIAGLFGFGDLTELVNEMSI